MSDTACETASSGSLALLQPNIAGRFLVCNKRCRRVCRSPCADFHIAKGHQISVEYLADNVLVLSTYTMVGSVVADRNLALPDTSLAMLVRYVAVAKAVVVLWSW